MSSDIVDDISEKMFKREKMTSDGIAKINATCYEQKSDTGSSKRYCANIGKNMSTASYVFDVFGDKPCKGSSKYPYYGASN